MELHEMILGGSIFLRVPPPRRNPLMSEPQISVMEIVPKPENVAQLVFFIRGEKVMFDADLAMLYGVTLKENTLKRR
jgi:hypothetical protein